MSSTPPLPSPDDDYNPPQGTRWNDATWRALFTSAPGGIGPRLRALEAQRQTLEDVITELRIFGLQRLDEALLPLINEQEQTLANLSAQIDATIAQTNTLVADFQEATEEALNGLTAQVSGAIDDLESQIAAVQAQIDAILANNIGAEHIVETADRVFVTPEQRQKLVEAPTPDDLAEKQSTAEKNQPNGYAGLDANGRLSSSQIGDPNPVGTIVAAMSRPSDKYLRLNGQKYQRSAYPELSAVVPKLPSFNSSSISWTSLGASPETLAVTSDMLFITLSSGISRMPRSNISGSWTTVNGASISSSYSSGASTVKDDVAYLAFDGASLVPVIRSVSGTGSWANIATNLPAGAVVHFIEFKAGFWWLGTSMGLYRGTSLTAMTEVLGTGWFVMSRPCYDPVADVWWLQASGATTSISLLRSLDGGATWAPARTFTVASRGVSVRGRPGAMVSCGNAIVTVVPNAGGGSFLDIYSKPNGPGDGTSFRFLGTVSGTAQNFWPVLDRVVLQTGFAEANRTLFDRDGNIVSEYAGFDSGGQMASAMGRAVSAFSPDKKVFYNILNVSSGIVGSLNYDADAELWLPPNINSTPIYGPEWVRALP